MDTALYTAIAALVSFITGVVLYRIFIPVLRRQKLGQKILEIGPAWHKSKEGTPNMGGLIFIVSCVIATAVGMIVFHSVVIPDGEGVSPAFEKTAKKLFALFALPLLNGLIGFVDDYIKLFKKRNKGLSATQKLVLQFIAAGLYLYGMYALIGNDTVIRFPWGGQLDLGAFYYVVMLLVIVYIINCANLTDGIDGLAGSIALIDCIMFLILFTVYGGSGDEAIVPIAALIGALVAFLVFNFHPAKIFMGDTGSLFLGGFIVSLSMLTGCEFLLLPVAFIWIIEGLSVVLQVISFKLTGKRIFKMSPIHHHFEKCGWSEAKIVFVFSFFTAVFAFLTYYLFTLFYSTLIK